MKKVHVGSIEPKQFPEFSNRYDKSKSTQKDKNKSNKNESLEEYIRRRSLSQNSSISSHRKSLNNMPQSILENFDDEKIILKHTTHTIEIEIIKFELSESSSLLENENANFLYIEYSFLNYKGHLLETQSLPKPKKSGVSTVYKLSTKFEINPAEHEEEFDLLKKTIEKKSKNPIKFLIVSEPINAVKDSSNTTSTLQTECEDVGFAIIKLNEQVQNSTSDFEILKAECFSTSFPHELIGYLHVKISGILILQKLANL